MISAELRYLRSRPASPKGCAVVQEHTAFATGHPSGVGDTGADADPASIRSAAAKIDRARREGRQCEGRGSYRYEH